MTASLDLATHAVGTKRFSMRDQEVFASLSMDYNPMHVDPIAARRLLTGRPVVHGIQVLMAALEYWVNEHALLPVSLDCTFNNAVNVDDVVVFSQRELEGGHVVVEARVEGLLCAKLRLATSLPAGRPDGKVIQTEPDHVGSESSLDPIRTPLNEPPAVHLRKTYLIRIDPVDLSGLFPRACFYLGSTRATGLLVLSYFVGMVCPGLNSIFSTLSLRLNENPHDAEFIRFCVDQYDERFRLFHVSLQGRLVGGLTAFVRPPPQQQLSMAEVSRSVQPGEFAGTRSLVIGGSRGLGEMTARILTAGGGDVVITYSQGLADSEMINADINANGPGTSELRQLDVMSVAFETVDFASYGAIYFFATPRIYRKKAAIFVTALFDEFFAFYVKHFYDLCLHIEGLALKKRVRIYVPSSVFVSERPEGLTEYAMAKAAAEVMIEDINRSFKNVSIVATRLPRLSTDQTSSVLKVSAGDNLSALLPIIRTMSR